MTERYIAAFDNELRRLKIICVRERPGLPSTFSPYTVGRTFKRVEITESSETEPNPKRILLEGPQHLYIWRTPWCMLHEQSNSWVPIFDADKPELFPGEFIYEGMYRFKNPLYEEYVNLHLAMVENCYQQESIRTAPRPIPRPAPAPSAPPATHPARKPPIFVGAIIKRDAIANAMSCSISLENFTEEMKAQITPCFHIFESTQLKEWISLKGSCPTCTASIQQEDCLVL